MSILIKGMEMPKNGEMKKIIIGRAPNGIDPIAIVTGDNTEFYKIIEVPTPHGRLIDADKLLKVIEENSYRLRSVINSTENGMFLSGIRQAIDEAPTIIEAEE